MVKSALGATGVVTGPTAVVPGWPGEAWIIRRISVWLRPAPPGPAFAGVVGILAGGRVAGGTLAGGACAGRGLPYVTPGGGYFAHFFTAGSGAVQEALLQGVSPELAEAQDLTKQPLPSAFLAPSAEAAPWTWEGVLQWMHMPRASWPLPTVAQASLH